MESRLVPRDSMVLPTDAEGGRQANLIPWRMPRCPRWKFPIWWRCGYGSRPVCTCHSCRGDMEQCWKYEGETKLETLTSHATCSQNAGSVPNT